MKKSTIVIGLISSFLHSQTGTDDKIIIKSPQSHSFEKYGNIPVNLFTGATDIKIPITEVNQKGLVIPVTLSYDSSGFSPHKKSDIAGVNWNILAGGRVTRTVQGIPDEYIGSQISLGPGQYHYGYAKKYSGFLYGVKNNSPTTNTQAYNINNGAGTIHHIDWVMGSPSTAYETRPDIFNFNIPGLISGKFIVGNNGNILVESEDPNIKVDLSEIAFYNTENICGVDIVSKITIIDGKGNKYIFGGDYSKYELTYTGNNILFQEGFSGLPVINSFSLSKIIQTDGREINFNYYNKSFSHDSCHRPILAAPNASYGLIVSLESHIQQGSTAEALANCPSSSSSFLCINESQVIRTNQTYYSILKKSVLTSIVYDDSEIRLNYKDLGYPIKYEYFSPSSFFINDWVIDNVETYYKNNLIRKSQFSYQDYGGEFKRPFLTQILDTKSNAVHAFNYYSNFSLPPYYTKALDHWGYYNGNDGNNYLAPYDQSYNFNTGDYNLNNTNRDPNGYYHNVALLQKITYPTRGYSTFEYEPHSYNKRLERNSGSSFLPVLTNNGGVSGGARIKKIQNFNYDNSLVGEKEYQYLTSFNGSTGSGILMYWPRYHYAYRYGPASGPYQSRIATTSSNVQTNSLDSYNVGYSKVFEIETNKGYTEYNFTNYGTHPDDLSEIGNYKKMPAPSGGSIPNDSEITPLNLVKNVFLTPIDKNGLRGKILSQKYFSQSDLVNPIKSIEYEYTDNIEFNPNSLQDNENFVSVNRPVVFWVQGYKKFMNSSHLKKKTIKDYFNGTEVKSETDYFYDSSANLSLSREVVKSSDNTEIKTNYQYLMDIWNGVPNHAASFAPPYAFMMNMYAKNMFSIPLVTTSYKNNTFLGRSQVLYNYSDSNVGILPKKLLSYTENKLVASRPYVDLPDTNFATEEVIYDLYDDRGNLQQYTTKDGISTTIIWGYNKTLPIAKITGAKLSDIPTSIITTLINASTTDGQAPPMSDETTFLQALELFRKDVSLSGFQVTTYSHDPLIGVRSITPPSGVREIYKYDSAGRLKEVRENSYSGNLLKEYNYNFKQ